MAFADRFAFEQEINDLDGKTRRVDRAPTERQRLGRWTIAFLIINRTVGSGIFTKAGQTLLETDSIGISLILWLVGGIFALCGTYIYLDFGLSTPRHVVRGEEVSVPRSGGEKNYFEFIYKSPERLATCMYGVGFIILGNLAANAYAFGEYVIEASGSDSTDPAQKPTIIGIAIGIITVAVLFHMFTRQGGIWLNNAFAMLKIGLLLAIIILGILKAADVHLGGETTSALPDNFNSATFDVRGTATGTANALVAVIYSYNGFQQPFFVLSELKSPRKRMTRWTFGTVLTIMVLYILVNASYYFVVPQQLVYANPTTNIAALFLHQVTGNEKAAQTMAAIMAVSAFGNIVVTTYTSARVKQELAKEGILPFSLFWATGQTTPWARIKTWYQYSVRHHVYETSEDLDHQEQSPVAALLLHWIFSVLLIAVTAGCTVSVAYNLLTDLYTYVIVILVGIFVSGGLVYLKLSPSRDWKNKSHFGALPSWLTIIPPVIYFSMCVFLAIIQFVKPSTYAATSYKPYYLVAIISITVPLWGAIYWALLKLYMRLTHKTLKVSRVPYVIPELGSEGKYIQAAEIMDHEWSPDVPDRMEAQHYSKVAYVEEYDLGTRPYQGGRMISD